jgi:hypothetical protein
MSEIKLEYKEDVYWSEGYRCSDYILTNIISGCKIGTATCRVHAEHIVKCVNEHDKLVAEVERLTKENERLKRAIRRCTPYRDNNQYYPICNFCGNIVIDDHKSDCEYVKLIKLSIS